MKQQIIELSQRYGTALQQYLKPGRLASRLLALQLGRQAVNLGLPTLELARMHEQALATLALPKNKPRLIQRADYFFNEALNPIMESHRAAGPDPRQLTRLNATLTQRTAEPASPHRQLKRGSLRRKVMAAARISGEDHNQCLEESLQLQTHLRQLTHRVMAAQEDERAKIGHELQDEIAQTLLGINVRLCSLKQEAWGNVQGLKNEIASTQRLAARSAKSVRQFAHQLAQTCNGSSHDDIRPRG